jgi:spore maturation protein CgeB
MLAEYSSDMASLYEEGREAEYFRTPTELLAKVRHYLANPAKREQIAEAGYARLIKDGHEVTDRARQITSTYERLTGEREAVARKSPTALVGSRIH